MAPILYAIPFFLLCIGIELLVSYKMNKKVYRLHDSVTSLNVGAMSEVLRGLTKLLTVVIYAVLVERVGTFTFDTSSPFVWVLAYVLYDFFYYWAHRAGHEVNFLWAAHVVHHSSEDFNLSTALRQSSTNTLFYWVFYVPMAVIGIPVQVFVTVALLSAIYGFWVHTRLIGKLGWFDRVFASPSNHRVHHGSNEYCLDKNYGFTFIIWDRLFGTYAEERDDEPVVYGTLVPINSWNPVWANFKNYLEIVRTAFAARGWRSKLMHVFGPPGWTPNGMMPHPVRDASNIPQFETPSTQMERIYGVLAALVIMFFLGHLLASLSQLTVPQRTLYGATIILAAFCVGRIFSAQRLDLQLEGLRVLCMFTAIATGTWFTVVTPGFRMLAVATLLTSGALLVAIHVQRSAVRKASNRGATA